jgi:hypothetical protein
MEDLIDSASTTAEQKFMLMMFERLEALEDKVTNLTVENQNLKKKLKYYDIPDLPADVYISKQLVVSPVTAIYCKITLKNIKYLALAMRILKEHYSAYAFLPHFFANIRSPYKEFDVPKNLYSNAVDLHCLLTGDKPQTIQQHVCQIHQKLKSCLLCFSQNSRSYPAIAACPALYMANYYYCGEFSYHQKYLITNRTLQLNRTYAKIAKDADRIYGEVIDVGIDYRNRVLDDSIMTVVNFLKREWKQNEIVFERNLDIENDDADDDDYDSEDVDDDDYESEWEDY